MQKKPRWGLLTLALFVGVIVVLVVAWWVQRHPRARTELKERIQALEQRNVPLRVEQVVRPPQRLGAESPWRDALQALPDELGTRDLLEDVRKEEVPGQRMARDLLWTKTPQPGQRFSPQGIRVLTDLVQRRRPALDLAERAAMGPLRGFAVELDEYDEPVHPDYLEDLGQLSHAMVWSCLLEAHRCRPAALADELGTLAVLPRAIGEPVTALEVRVRADLSRLVAVAALECLNLCTLPPEALHQLQQHMARREQTLDIGQAINTERALVLQALPPGWQAPGPARDAELRHAGAVRALLQLDILAQAEQVAQAPDQKRLRGASELFEFRQEDSPLLMPGAVESMARRMAMMFLDNLRARVNLQLVRVLMAAERYRQEHDSWPRSADALVPDYLPELPIDPAADAQPLAYRVAEDGVVVSSAEADVENYKPVEMKLLNPGLRGAEQRDFHQAVVSLQDWEPAERARALHRLGFTRQELANAGFTTEELGGWEPGMEEPPHEEPDEED